MSTGKKIALGIVLFFVALLVAAVIVVPMLVDIDRYRPRIIAYIQEETGKPAEIGRLSLTLRPTVSIRVDDFALGNPAGFPKGYFLKTRRIYAEVEARALWDRQVVIKSLELDAPVIQMLSDVRGKWNFENPSKPRGAQRPSPQEPAAFTLGVISKVSIAGGELAVATLLSSGRPGPTFFEGRGIASDLEQVDLNAFIASTAASLMPHPSAIRRPHWTLLATTVAYADTASPKPAAEGNLAAESLRFGALQVTSVKSKLRLFAKQVHFDGLIFDLYGGHSTGELSFNFAGQNPRYSASARLSGVDMARLLEAFPDARGKMSGKMEGHMKLSGAVTRSPDPLAGMRGAGQASIRDGQLPSLQLNKNLMQLARLASLGSAQGDPSSFSRISADLNIANQRITSTKITVVGTGVDVEGAGSVALAGAGNLDYEGVAKVAAGETAVTNLLAGLSGATYADGKLTFPFSLTGTLQNPQFKVKSTATVEERFGVLQNLAGGVAGQQSTTQPGQTPPQSPADLVQGITGLFKKKQPTQQPQQQTPQQPKQ